MFESFLSKTKEHWPIVTVVVTGILYLFGYVHEVGYWETLGVTALSRPTVREGFIIEGLLAVISFIGMPVALAALALLGWSFAHYAVARGRLKDRIAVFVSTVLGHADDLRKSQSYS